MAISSLRTLNDCEDLLDGARWLATGGGGLRETGLRLLRDALDDGLSLQWIDAEAIPDDDLTVTVGTHGSGVPGTRETLEEARAMGLVKAGVEKNPAEILHAARSVTTAVKELGAYLGKNVGALVAGEIGAGALAYPLAAGARLGIPVVDGDYSGRAVPEELQGTPCLYGKQRNILAAVDPWGDVIIVKNAVNLGMLERYAKMLALAAYGSVATATVPLSGKEMKEIVISGTLGKSFRIGQAVRAAREKGEDPVDAAVEQMDGWKLFQGRITRLDRSVSEHGYLVGRSELEGTNDFQRQKLKLWFKNEHHISWLNDKPWVCSPDGISLVHLQTHKAMSISDMCEGDEMVAVGFKGHEGFRTGHGLSLAGPAHYGFNIEYVPIEELMTI